MLVSVFLEMKPVEGENVRYNKEVEVARGCPLHKDMDTLGECLADALMALVSLEQAIEVLTVMTTDVQDALGNSE